MKRRPRLMFSLLASATLVLTACGGGTSDTAGSGGAGGDGNADGTSAAVSNAGGEATDNPDTDYDPDAIVRWAVPGSPTSFDLRKSSPLDPMFLDSVYEPLIKRTGTGDLEPGLATEWKFSQDGTVLDLTLRDGVTFHDGETFNAAAVVASLEAWAETGSQASVLSSIDTVEAVDDQHVKITFTEPAGYMLNVLAGEPGMIVSPKSLDDPDLGTSPVGTGPYTLTSLEQGKFSFRRFDDYWDPDSVHNGGVDMTLFSDEPTRLRAVVSGEADATSIGAGQVQETKTKGLTLAQGPSTTFYAILLNTSDPTLANPLVRKALLHAIDRQTMTKALFDGSCVPAVQPFQKGFAPNVPELNDTAPYFDIDKAKQLLAEAGLPDGFELELSHGMNTTNQNLGQILQAQLGEIGVKVTVKKLDFGQNQEARRTGKFQAALALLQPGRPDPSQFIVDFYSPGSPYNPGNYELDGLAENLAKARASDDEAARSTMLQGIFSDVLEAGPPLIPICSVTWGGALATNISGFEVPSFGDYHFASIKVGK